MDFFRTYRCSVFLKQITDSKHKYLKRTRLKTSSVPDREILRLKWNLKYPYIFNFIDLFDFFKNTFKLVQSIIQSKPNYCMYFQNKFKLVQSIASLFKKGKKIEWATRIKIYITELKGTKVQYTSELSVLASMTDS